MTENDLPAEGIASRPGDGVNKGFKPSRVGLGALLLASMLILMGGAAVAPSLPKISEAFPDASSLMVSLIISVPSLGVAVFGFLVGAAADRVGKVRTLAAALLVFTVAGVSAFFLSDLNIILVGRFILGLGMAGIGVTTTALITEYYDGQERLKVIGFQSAAMGVGTVVLELAGGALSEIGWREPFLIYFIGLAAFFGTVGFLREPQRGGAGNGESVIPLPSDWKRTALICYVLVFLLHMFMFVYPSKAAYYVNEYIGTGGGALLTGGILAFFGFCNAAMSMFQHRLSSSVDIPTRIGIGFLCFAIGGFFMWVSPGLVTAILGFAFVGLGMGWALPSIVNWLSSACRPKNSGLVMGGYTAMLNLGMFAASFVMVPILDLAGGQSEYAGMYLICGAITPIVSALVFLYRPVYRRANRY